MEPEVEILDGSPKIYSSEVESYIDGSYVTRWTTPFIQDSDLPAINRLLETLSSRTGVQTYDTLDQCCNRMTGSWWVVCRLGNHIGRNLVGTATLIIVNSLGGKYGLVEDVSVLPEHQGKGIGRELMKAVIGKARNMGCKSVRLTSRPEREAANHLYRDVLGFERKDTNYYVLSFDSDDTGADS